MSKISIRIEHTRSRTGRHHRMALALVINLRGGASLPDPRELKPCRGTYVKGFAYCGEYSVPKGCMLAYIYVTYGLRGRCKGSVSIFDENGYEVLKLKYINNKMRVVSGDSRYTSYALMALNNIYRVDEYERHR
ncbi:MAG: hypothetical protein N3D82_03160 [Ignisphaera sp.]|nr:hypothetical protein [Ignisphaera sp.]MCX8168009.1 hypothetical protein [Ignisphaera sp.]MDW8085520.1 hypothetical protein [Ignisphaera sp.]